MVGASCAKGAGLVVVAHFEGEDCFGFLALQLEVGGRPHDVEDAAAGDFKLRSDRIVHVVLQLLLVHGLVVLGVDQLGPVGDVATSLLGVRLAILMQ